MNENHQPDQAHLRSHLHARLDFAVADFRSTLMQAESGDLVYADPPYAGRHVDYFNSWSESDETELAGLLKQLPCGFILSTWHSNEFRTNPLIEQNYRASLSYSDARALLPRRSY